MPKLRYALYEINRNIIFTIFEQDERFLNRSFSHASYSKFNFHSSNNWLVKSAGMPEININTHTIYLRGSSKDMDNRISIVTNEHNPQKIIDQIDEALREWSKDWSGWRDETEFNFRTKEV